MRSVLQQNYSNFDTIVVDNDSSDRSVEVIRRFLPKVKLIENRTNMGYTGALNAAALEVSEDSELLAIVTNDVVLSEDWLERVVEAIDTSYSIGAASSRVLEGRRGTTITELRIVYPSCTLYTPWNKKIDRIVQTDCPTGQAFIVRKQVFRSVGAFDPDYFAYYDDADLGWRIRLQGYKVVYTPLGRVIHKGHHSFGRLPVFPPTAHILSERNRMLACLKNLAPTSLPAFILAEAFNIIYRTFRGIFSKQWRPIDKGYILALVEFVRRLKRAWERRALVQRSRRRTDREIFSTSLPRIMEPTSRKELILRSVLEIVSKIFPAR